ncbi:hypothetical protein K435DRAFT_473027 [Dendrothele bispora CBS 962.96]|uniref:Uncharacterized protein n=1 Tax=Dendrothele bispora (strain CBS 962.96) TaxID=1314807 RepID=A0A4S8MCY3_DENBC|nr:hypothetical protein K435DRAFT_473027 [Dendrothele bispora CBS 962.96]
MLATLCRADCPIGSSSDQRFESSAANPTVLRQYLPEASEDQVEMFKNNIQTMAPSSRASLQQLRDFVCLDCAPVREKNGFFAQTFKF